MIPRLDIFAGMESTGRDLSVEYGKLHAWKLTEFGKVLIIDADGLILGPIKHLFDDRYYGPTVNGRAERTGTIFSGALLSLVPNAVREWMAVGAQQYLSFDEMMLFDRIPGRTLHRMQIELIAGRVSSHNECFY